MARRREFSTNGKHFYLAVINTVWNWTITDKNKVREKHIGDGNVSLVMLICCVFQLIYSVFILEKMVFFFSFFSFLFRLKNVFDFSIIPGPNEWCVRVLWAIRLNTDWNSNSKVFNVVRLHYGPGCYQKKAMKRRIRPKQYQDGDFSVFIRGNGLVLTILF